MQSIVIVKTTNDRMIFLELKWIVTKRVSSALRKQPSSQGNDARPEQANFNAKPALWQITQEKAAALSLDHIADNCQPQT